MNNESLLAIATNIVNRGPSRVRGLDGIVYHPNRWREMGGSMPEYCGIRDDGWSIASPAGNTKDAWDLWDNWAGFMILNTLRGQKGYDLYRSTAPPFFEEHVAFVYLDHNGLTGVDARRVYEDQSLGLVEKLQKQAIKPPKPNDVVYNTSRDMRVRVYDVIRGPDADGKEVIWVRYAYPASNPMNGSAEVYLDADVWPLCFDPDSISDTFRDAE